MTRQRTASLLTALASAGYVATAALHATGFRNVSRLAEQGPPDLHGLVPLLWLAVSADLIVVGLVVAVVAARPSPTGGIILAVAALCPFAAAALQFRFLGFIPPTALLLALGGLTLTAAFTQPSGARA